MRHPQAIFPMHSYKFRLSCSHTGCFKCFTNALKVSHTEHQNVWIKHIRDCLYRAPKCGQFQSISNNLGVSITLGTQKHILLVSFKQELLSCKQEWDLISLHSPFVFCCLFICCVSLNFSFSFHLSFLCTVLFPCFDVLFSYFFLFFLFTSHLHVGFTYLYTLICIILFLTLPIFFYSCLFLILL